MLFRPVAPGLGQEAFEAHFLAVEVLGLVGMVRFTSIFPRPLGADELEPLETLPRILLPIYRAAVLMRARGAPMIAGVLVLASLWGWTLASGRALSDAGLRRDGGNST
jgi:hypothetical protein